MLRMALLSAIGRHASTRLAEISFVLVALAGLWLILAEVPTIRHRFGRTRVAGIALVLAGLLLVVAAHFGRFG